LRVFDDVKVVARTKDVPAMNGKKLRVDGEHVEVFGIPFYQGPEELLGVYWKIQRRLEGVGRDCAAALMRMPSQTAFMAYAHLQRGLPVAGEIVYDLTDDLRRPGLGLASVLNRITSDRMKRFCRNANGVAYVTEYTIQKHYPSHAMLYGESREYFDTYYSTVTLTDSAFTCARDYSNHKGLRLVLSSVAMNSGRKGEKTVIEVVKKCRDKGRDVSAVLIGDGSLRHSFEEYACQLGVGGFIEFTGLLPTSDDVREVMQGADVFVFPTQGEGLPRGVLEAMAIGLPVLSTPVGGIPEVIPGKYLFQPADSGGFSEMLCHLLDHRAELNEMSRNNFEKSQEYRNVILQQRRDAFYQRLRSLAEMGACGR